MKSLPGGGRTQCNSGGNSVSQGALSLFVDRASCGVGGLSGCSGASYVVSRLGIGR